MYVHIGPVGSNSGRPPVAGRTGSDGRGPPGVRANRGKPRDGKVMGTKVPKIPEIRSFRKLSEDVFGRRGAMSARLLEIGQRTRKGDGAKHGS